MKGSKERKGKAETWVVEAALSQAALTGKDIEQVTITNFIPRQELG